MNDYKNAIEKLILKGAIQKCKEKKNQYLSNYFLREKPDGSHRFIFNLKNLNKNITAPHFKMENIKTAEKLIFQKCFMATIDVEDAYFLIPIHKSRRKYLRFEFQGTLYEFTCLPFGLNVSPFVYTKILKIVVNLLRSRGFTSVIYLDDILIIDKDFYKCQQNIRETINLLESLGFIIRYKKSNLRPSTRSSYLGFILDSETLTVELTKKKINNLKKKLKIIKRKSSCKIREFAKIIGQLIAACPGVEYGLLYTRKMEKE